MIRVLKYLVGQLETNCYFVVDGKNNCLIIDPGDEGSFLLEEIQRNRLKPAAILATHGHFDHLMAIGEIQQSFDVPFYINQKDQFLVNRIEETAQYFLGYKPVILPIRRINYFQSDFLNIESWSLKIFHTPGHTPGSSCFYLEKEKLLFTGDTLFNKGIGRYDFSYSNKKDLIDSLKKIIKLPDDIKVYPGHGELTIIKKARNFLYQEAILDH